MNLEWIELSQEQLEDHLAANGLQLQNTRKEPVFVLSKSAFQSLDANQIQTIEKYSKLVWADIPTFEKIGGGSIRCMLAECHWQPRAT